MNKDTKKYFEESEGGGIDDDNLTKPGDGIGFYEGDDFALSVPEFEFDDNEFDYDPIENPLEIDEPEYELPEFDSGDLGYNPDDFNSSLPSDNLGLGNNQNNQNLFNLEGVNGNTRVLDGFRNNANTGNNSNTNISNNRFIPDHLVFDAEYYRQQNPEVLTLDPFADFVQFGAAEGRDYRYTIEPNYTPPENASAFSEVGISRNYSLPPDIEDTKSFVTNDGDFLAFDTDYYIQQNPDLASAGVDPVTHFTKSGLNEDRDHRYVFVDDLLTYDSTGSVNQAQDSLLNNSSQSTTGFNTGFDTEFNAYRSFDRQYYLQENPDIAAAGIDPYQHYLTAGIGEGRSPNVYYDLFPPESFTSANTDNFDTSNNSLI